MTFIVDDAYGALFERAGLRALSDVLARADCVRDLPDRSNHELVVDGLRIHVKRTKPKRFRRPASSAEAAGIRQLQDAGVRTACILFEALDAKHGAATGTRDLAPARPLDDVLGSAPLSYLQTRAITFDLARQVAALHGAGLHHKDLYLNHVFVDSGAALPTCTLIDCERVDSHRGAFSRWVIKDLAALEHSAAQAGVSRSVRLRFVLAYLSARGEPVDVFFRHFLPQVQAKARRMAAHRPRTPVGEAARPRADDRA